MLTAWGWGSLILLPPLLLAQPFARQCLLRATLLTRLHVITVLFNFLDDIFLLHFALEPAQRIFQRFTLLNADFSHLEFTILPMHVAMIAVFHLRYERRTPYKCVLALTSSGPAPRSQALFFQRRPRRSIWDFAQYLLECRSGNSPVLVIPGSGKEMPHVLDA
jgi:hypothetical protein